MVQKHKLVYYVYSKGIITDLTRFLKIIKVSKNDVSFFVGNESCWAEI